MIELDGSDRMKSMRGKIFHIGLRGQKPVSEVDRVELRTTCWSIWKIVRKKKKY